MAYGDDKAQMNVISAVCRKAENIKSSYPSASVKLSKSFVCDSHEVLAGISSKDISSKNGAENDKLKSITPLCQKPGSKSIRKVANVDADSNGSSERRQAVYLPEKVVGLAWKMLGSDNFADCVTIITK